MLADYSGLGLANQSLDLSDLQIRPKSVVLSSDEAIILGSLSSLKGHQYGSFLSRALPDIPDEGCLALGLPAFSDQDYERDHTLDQEGNLYNRSNNVAHYCENAMILAHKERISKEGIKKILFDLSLVSSGLIVGHDYWQNLFLIASGKAAVLGAERGENVFVLSDPGFSGILIGGKGSENLLDLSALSSYSAKLGSCDDFDRAAYVKDWFIRKGAPGAATQSPVLPSGVYGMNELILSAGITLEGRAEGMRFIVEPKPGSACVNLQASQCRLVFPKTALLSEAEIVYDKKTNVLSIKIKLVEGDFSLQIERYLDRKSGLPAYDMTDRYGSVLTPLLDAKATDSVDSEKPSFALRARSSLEKEAAISYYDETLIKGSQYSIC